MNSSLLMDVTVNFTFGTNTTNGMCKPSEKLEPAFQIPLYCLIITASLIGNSLIIAVVTRTKRMQTFSNILICNISVADLMITLLPMSWEVVRLAKYNDDTWPLGKFMCVFAHLFIYISVAATAMSLMATSIDRFYLIARPQDYKLKTSHHRYVILGIWLISFLFGLPTTFAQKVVKIKSTEKYACIEQWQSPFHPEDSPKIYTTFLFTFLYVLPLASMAVLYSKLCCNLWLRLNPDFTTSERRKKSIARKKRIVIMLIIIVMIFAIGWFPIFLLQFLVYFHPHYIQCPLDVPDAFVFTGFFLEYLSCALSPLVYFTFSSSYREGLAGLFFSPRRRRLRERNATISRIPLTKCSPTCSNTLKAESTEKLAPEENGNTTWKLATSNASRSSFLTTDSRLSR